MHELPRNRPAVRRKWIKFIQFKRSDFLAAPHHVHLCSEHFSECDVCMGVHRVTDLEKFPVRVSRDEAPFCMGVHRVTDLEKFPVRVSRDEAPTPLPLFGLVI